MKSENDPQSRSDRREHLRRRIGARRPWADETVGISRSSVTQGERDDSLTRHAGSHKLDRDKGDGTVKSPNTETPPINRSTLKSGAAKTINHEWMATTH